MNTSLSIDVARRDKISIPAGYLKEHMALATGALVVRVDSLASEPTVQVTLKRGASLSTVTLDKQDTILIFD
jgi:hypothetical protein